MRLPRARNSLFRHACGALMNTVCSSDDQAGGSPAATHFLCCAKESKQRKATASSQPPTGVSGVVEHKSGRETNSLRSDKFPFFIRFALAATGCSQAGIRDWLAAHRQGREVKWRFVFFATFATVTIATPKASAPLAMRSEPVWPFRLEPAGDAMQKMEKEGRLSERSEFSVLPIFCIASPGSPKGLDPVALEQCSNPFFAYFLWRSKESE